MKIISYKEFTELCRKIVEKQLIPTSGRIEDGGYLLCISLVIEDAVIEVYLSFDGKSDYKYCKAVVEVDLHLSFEDTEEISKIENIMRGTFIAAKKLATTLQDYQIDFNSAWNDGHFEKYEWNGIA